MDILIIEVRGEPPREHVLAGDRIEIGDSPGTGIALPGSGLAARHFALERNENGWRLDDLGSDGGTLVNGLFVGRRQLRGGDRIECAGVRFRIESRPDGARSSNPVVARPKAEAAASAPKPASPAPVRPGAAAFHDVLFAEPPARDPARASEVGAPEPRPQREPGATSSSIRRAASRQRARRFVTAVVALTTCAAAAIVYVAVVAPRAGRGADLSLARERFELAAACVDAREFARARAILDELRATPTHEVSMSLVETERARVDREESRHRHAEEIAADLLADTEGPAELRLERAKQALTDYADLPAAVRIGAALRAAERAVAASRTRTDGALIERLDTARTRALKGEFGAAKTIFDEVGRSELETDRFLAQHGAAAIEGAARVVAEDLIARATKDLAEGDILGASILMEDEKVAGLRGTALGGEVEQVAAAVDVQLKALPNRGTGLVNIPVRDRTKPAEESATKPTPPVERSSPPSDSGVVPAAVARAESALDPLTRQIVREADALYSAADIEGSAALLEKALAEANANGRVVLEQRLSRARHAQNFLAGLLGKIDANPKAVAAVDVKAKDGSHGRVGGVRHGMLVVLTPEGGEVELLPSDLEPGSCLALARKLPWTPAESLERASFALIVGEAKDIDQALARAIEDGNNKAAADVLIALWRGLDVVPEWGFFRVDGTWITFKEREERLYDKQVTDAVAKLDRGDKAWDDAIAALNELLPVAPKPIARELAARRTKQLAKLVGLGEWHAIERLEADRAKLEAARKHALELIFDEVKYFYPYNPPEVPPDIAKLYPAVQQEVDDRVAKVREIWGNEHGEAPPGVALSESFRRLVKMLSGERPLLAIADPDRKFDDPVEARLDLLPVNVTSMSIRDVAADSGERARLDQDRQVMALNQTVTTSATGDDLDQLRITNEYRRMMGRRALAVNEKLMRAARGHSEWMSRTGKFNHMNDEDPALRSPFQRMAAQGYSGGSGENLAITGGPMDAHHGWTHSSGHHRNLLWESHTELGVSGVGRYWTQNFGGGTEYAGNLAGEGN